SLPRRSAPILPFSTSTTGTPKAAAPAATATPPAVPPSTQMSGLSVVAIQACPAAGRVASRQPAQPITTAGGTATRVGRRCSQSPPLRRRCPAGQRGGIHLDCAARWRRLLCRLRLTNAMASHWVVWRAALGGALVGIAGQISAPLQTG